MLKGLLLNINRTIYSRENNATIMYYDIEFKNDYPNYGAIFEKESVSSYLRNRFQFPKF